MSNPYQPSVAYSTRDKVAPPPSPTLDLNPDGGAEYKQILPTAPQSGEAVPDGNIREVLEWVGSDKTRARQAARDEKASDDPRQTLLFRLKKITNA